VTRCDDDDLSDNVKVIHASASTGQRQKLNLHPSSRHHRHHLVSSNSINVEKQSKVSGKYLIPDAANLKTSFCKLHQIYTFQSQKTEFVPGGEAILTL